MFKTNNRLFNNKSYYIIAVLNRTPDSFYDGGKYLDDDKALLHIGRMIENGADIIDIGGESSRPGSKEVTLDEEIKRTIPIIKKIKNNYPNVCISIDTVKSQVAHEAIKAGAEIINDISGTEFDDKMISTAVENNCSIILNHIQGTPESMQKNPVYNNVVSEVKDFLLDKANMLIKAGLCKDKIMIDPGIGFGKTLEHNLLILKNIKEFVDTGYSVLIGVSRKSFIDKIDSSAPNDRLGGTISSNIFAFINGVKFFRVHDVFENSQALKIIDRIIHAG